MWMAVMLSTTISKEDKNGARIAMARPVHIFCGSLCWLVKMEEFVVKVGIGTALRWSELSPEHVLTRRVMRQKNEKGGLRMHYTCKTL